MTVSIEDYSAEQIEVARAIHASFLAYGLSEAQVAGVVANADAESSLRPSAEGDESWAGRYTAFGLWQLHSGPPGVAKMTVAEQCSIMLEMLQSSEREAFVQLKTATTPYDAAVLFSIYFERPGALGQSAKRGALGNMWFEYFNPIEAAP